MAELDSDEELLEAWRRGSEDAASTLFRRYQVRLLALVRSRLSRKLARRIDPEDVLLSAYRSFFLSARRPAASEPEQGNLWSLLVTITLRKLYHQVRWHQTQGRSPDREQSDPSAWLEHLVQTGPSSEHAAILADEVELLLGRLDATAREVLVRTLQGYAPGETAQGLGITDRSVRRALERIDRALPAQPMARQRQRPRPQIPIRLAAPEPVVPPQGTTTFDQFLLQEFVGSGAFSKVYRARERSSGDTVAVKFLRRECWNDPRAAQSVIREFEIMRQINHRGIVRMYDWGTTPRGALFLVSEYIDGPDLNEWRQRKQVSAHEIMRIGRDVARAIGTAHACGVLHGDIKPSNVMMRPDGEVVLCDFGLARYATDPEDVPRGGTAGFLAPEQISDAFGSINERTDVYGLGGLLYALLTGQAPTVGKDLPEVLSRVLSPEMSDPPSHHSSLSFPEFDAFVMRCLAKEPSARWSTAEAASGALEALLSEHGSLSSTAKSPDASAFRG